jgi:hypothetical protein
LLLCTAAIDSDVQDEDFMLNLSGDHKERVARFVADLLEEDEEEAELPALAMRRPVVMAVAVQSETEEYAVFKT